MTTTERSSGQKKILDLPAPITIVVEWMESLPPTAIIESTTYNSFKKGSGKTKVQRLLAHW